LKSPSIRSSAPGSSMLSCSSSDELLSSAGDRLYVEWSSKSSTSIDEFDSIQFILKSGQADRTGPWRSGASLTFPFPIPLVLLFTRCALLRSHVLTTHGNPRSSLCLRLGVRRRPYSPSSKARPPLFSLRSCQNERAECYIIIRLATAFPLYPRGRASR
jgi:hypothetical protein